VNPEVHRTHVYFESGSLILADFQVVPPSVLTSTFDRSSNKFIIDQVIVDGISSSVTNEGIVAVLIPTFCF
jgi:hypothetical protein